MGFRPKVCPPLILKTCHCRITFRLHLLSHLTAVHFPKCLPTPMDTPQISGQGCDRVFNPRGLSQHLSKVQNSKCHPKQMALKMPSVFQTASPAGSSLASNSNPLSQDNCDTHSDEPSGEHPKVENIPQDAYNAVLIRAERT